MRLNDGVLVPMLSKAAGINVVLDIGKIGDGSDYKENPRKNLELS